MNYRPRVISYLLIILFKVVNKNDVFSAILDLEECLQLAMGEIVLEGHCCRTLSFAKDC